MSQPLKVRVYANIETGLLDRLNAVCAGVQGPSADSELRKGIRSQILRRAIRALVAAYERHYQATGRWVGVTAAEILEEAAKTLIPLEEEIESDDLDTTY